MKRPPAYLIVPAVTLTVATSLLLTVASPRTLVAARLWGGPSTQGPLSLRVQCVRRAVGVEDNIPLAGLSIEIDGQAVGASCDENGHGDVAISLPTSGRHAVAILHQGATLARGEAHVTEASWGAGAHETPAALGGAGPLPVHASVEGGTLLMEHRGRVALSLPDELRKPGALRLTGTGVELGREEPTSAGLELSVKPTFFTATLRVEQAAEPHASWEARLPVAMSGVAAEHIEVAHKKVRGVLRSLTPRKLAFVQVQDQRQRVAAATVRLAPGPHGHTGPFELDAPALSGDAWLVVHTSPQPSPETSLSWPLSARAPGGRVVLDQLWLDGMAPAVRREADRLGQRLGAVGAVVLAGALLEALLLYGRARASRAEFMQRMREADDESPAERYEDARGWQRFALGVAVVLFGFAVVGALLVGRIE